MGQRGPKPVPTKILQMRGSWLANQRQKGEPVVEMGAPPVPSTLTAAERSTWRRLVERLDRAGLLAIIDGDVLGRYCVLYGQWLKAVKFVREHGQSYETTDQAGNLTYKVYPEVRLMLAFHKDLARIEQSFGMSPSARASLGALVAQGKQADGDHEQTQATGKSRFFSAG